MRLKRIYAANIREGMRRVREELGAEAVILSNRRIEDGIEIVAAIDYDERAYAGMQQAAAAAEAAPPAAASPAPAEPVVPAAAPAPTVAAAAAGPAAPAWMPPARPQPEPSLWVPPKPVAAAPRQAPAARAAGARPEAAGAKGAVSWTHDPVIVQMQTEISALRNLLEQQLTSIAWGREGARQPRRFELLERLLKFGLDAELCYELCDAALAEADGERAWQSALGQLRRGLATLDEDPLERGGAIALVGPTGVGKTTTVAKLAARYTLRHGPRKVGLITTDGYRIGAYDQLRTYGMILDLPVRVAGDAPELRQALADFADKSLVLIDTAGMSQRDLRLAQQIGMLQTAPAVRSYLVLPANGHPAALAESVHAFSGVQLAGGILSKLDECARIAGVISMLYRTRLPLAWFTTGQRVPEDIVAARAETLMATALDQQLADCSVADDAMLVTWGRRITNVCQ